MKKMLTALAIVATFMSLGARAEDKAATPAADYMPSLITATPLEGRKLAMTIVRKTVGAIQTDKGAKHRVRDVYAEDPVMLMRAVELVNLEFRIIAEANNYWRK